MEHARTGAQVPYGPVYTLPQNISAEKFYGPPKPAPVPAPAPPSAAAEPAAAPAAASRKKPPSLTVAQRTFVESQHASISRVPNRSLRAPVAKVGSGDFASSQKIANVTMRCARCVC